MKKSAKLLSVLLAVLMIFSSVSVLASAKTIQYQTGEQLQALGAYSPDGQVTRLDTEERISILADSLETVLPNFKTATLVGDLLDQNGLGILKSLVCNTILGGDIYVDITSINGICTTLDNLQPRLGPKGNLTKLLGNYTHLQGLNLNNWTVGKTRTSSATSHTDMILDLMNVLGNTENIRVIVDVLLTEGVVTTLPFGLDGTVANALAGVKIAGMPLNDVLKNVPQLLKNLFVPMMNRVDDTTAEADAHYATQTSAAEADSFEIMLGKVLVDLFTKSQGYAEYKYDSNFNCVTAHPKNAIEWKNYTADKRDKVTLVNEHTKNAYITVESYNPATKLHEPVKTKDGKVAEFKLTAEVNAKKEPTGYYTFTNADGENFKYNLVGNVWLPQLKADIEANRQAYNLQTASLADLFYRVVPFIFSDLGVPVLNGSVKQALAKWFGADFEAGYVGRVDSEEVKALPVYNAQLPIFQLEHPQYTFDWSDYMVFGYDAAKGAAGRGTHVWRFRDDIYVAKLDNCNPFFDIIDWNYKIDGTFFNEFLPQNTNFTTFFQSLNNFGKKAIDTLVNPILAAPIVKEWAVGDNSLLVENIKMAVRTLFVASPESIFGEHYASDPYYNIIMTSKDNNEIICAVACELCKMLMPQLVLPAAETMKNIKLGAMFAYILREVVTELMPQYRYDDLIFANDADYNNRVLRNETNEYWLDVCLTIGIDLGMYYLNNLTDMGRDQAAGYEKIFTQKEYTYQAFKEDCAKPIKNWEAKFDWLIDCAMTTGEWTWNGEQLVDLGTIDLATAQDPWVKITKLLDKILPISTILNTDSAASLKDQNMTWLESALRYKLILPILALDLTPVFGGAEANGLLNIRQNCTLVRNTGLFPMVEKIAKDLLNNLFWDLNGKANIVPASIADNLMIDSILTQGNIRALLRAVMSALPKAAPGVVKFVFPILNNVVGYKVTRQELAEPQISIFNSDNQNFIYTGNNAEGQAVTNAIRIYNASSGMVEKHDKTYDNPYTVEIKAVRINNKNQNLPTSFNKNLYPGEKTELDISSNKDVTADRGNVHVEVDYVVHFKNTSKTAIGGQQTAHFYTWTQATKTDLNFYKTVNPEKQTIFGGKMSDISISHNSSPACVPENVAETINKYTVKVYNAAKKQQFKPIDGQRYTSRTDYIETTGNNYTNPVKAQSTYEYNPMRIKTTAQLPKFVPGSKIDLGADFFSGKWDAVGGEQGNASYDFGYLYVLPHLTQLQALFNTAVKFQKQNFKGQTVNTVWGQFQNNMKLAAKLLYKPMMQADFTGAKSMYTQENVDKAYNGLKTAVDALLAIADTGDIQGMYNSLNTDKMKHPAYNSEAYHVDNFTFFTYFQFDKERQWTNKIVYDYMSKPQAPTKYIPGSNLGNTLTAEQINAVKAGANATKQQAIDDLLKPATPDMQTAYEKALAAYKAPAYTTLELANAQLKLDYYAQYLVSKAGGDPFFLNKEIASSEARITAQDKAKYSTESWARYEAALAKAKEAALTKSQREMFNAKYHLEYAQNELRLKEYSCRDNGYYDQLNALIAQAEQIFANPTAFDLAAGAAMTKNEALANLLSVLGYEYVENGVTKQLFPNSAMEFAKVDLKVGPQKLGMVDAKVRELKDALANFVSNAVTIVPEAQSGAVTDTVKQIVHGLDLAKDITPESIAALVKANSGNYTIQTVANNQGACGTGALVTVKDNEKVLAAYTVIIYGDVNGDAVIDAFDAADANAVLKDQAKFENEFAIASDANRGNDAFSVADYTAIVEDAAGITSINQK